MTEPLNQLAAYVALNRNDCVLDWEIIKEELTFNVAPANLIDFIRFLAKDSRCKFSTLVDITAVDYPERGKRFDVVYPSIGENFSFLKKLIKKNDLKINFITRKEDQFCWKFSNKGYFNFRSNIPIILSTFKLN